MLIFSKILASIDKWGPIGPIQPKIDLRDAFVPNRQRWASKHPKRCILFIITLRGPWELMPVDDDRVTASLVELVEHARELPAPVVGL
jgi:hypothetical protein